MIFDTKVAGIPCQCKVIGYSPYREMKVYGSGMGDCHPPEPEDFDFEILDRKGYRAKWLEAKMTKKDQRQVLEDFHIENDGERYGYL